MARDRDTNWGGRRPATRRRKPYNDDYKDDYLDDYDYIDEDDDVKTYRPSRDRSYNDRRRQETDRDRRGRDAEGRAASSRAADARRRAAGADRRPRDFESREGIRRTSQEAGRRREDDRRYDDRRREAEARRRREDDRRYDDRRRDPGYDDRRPPKKKRSFGCLVGVIFLIVIAVAIGGLLATIASIWNKVDGADFKKSDIKVNADLPASVAAHSKDYKQFMIFGVDSRDNTTLEAGTLADSNILCTINKKSGQVTLTSIYRDTYVETTMGETMKLTEVYSKYGAKEQLQTINKNFDLNITDYLTVNWASVAKTINELDGIDISLSEAECSGINKYIDEVIDSTGIQSGHVDVSEGVHHLDGVQAVTYCRLRKGLGDDYKRTERQRTVINLTLERAKSAGIPKVLSVCNDVFPGLSSSMSLADVVSLGGSVGKYQIGASEGFPYDNATQDGGRYYLFADTLTSNVTALHQKVYGDSEYSPSGTVETLSQQMKDAQ